MQISKSKVTSKGQIVIPKEIRARYGIKPSSVIRWIQKPEGILMVPDSPDSVLAARGMIGKSGLLKKLVEARKDERKREDNRG